MRMCLAHHCRAMLEREEEPKARISIMETEESGSSHGSSDSADKSEEKCEEDIGFQVLEKAMRRVEYLIEEADISDAAREWLTEVRQLRQRGWLRDDDSDHFDDYLDDD